MLSLLNLPLCVVGPRWSFSRYKFSLFIYILLIFLLLYCLLGSGVPKVKKENSSDRDYGCVFWSHNHLILSLPNEAVFDTVCSQRDRFKVENWLFCTLIVYTNVRQQVKVEELEKGMSTFSVSIASYLRLLCNQELQEAIERSQIQKRNEINTDMSLGMPADDLWSLELRTYVGF